MNPQVKITAINDVEVLLEKEKSYGDSWKKRGGVGAFMMLARKWDRIENQCSKNAYDIFKCDVNEKDGLLDDIADLRRYLLLVEAEILSLNANVYHLTKDVEDRHNQALANAVDPDMFKWKAKVIYDDAVEELSGQTAISPMLEKAMKDFGEEPQSKGYVDQG